MKMRNSTPFILAAMIFAAVSSVQGAYALEGMAETENTNDAPVNVDMLIDVARRGQMLYDYDQAAWHSTDALREDIKNLGKSGIRGWIVVPAENGFRAIYYGKRANVPYAIYSAVWTGENIEQRMIHKTAAEQSMSDEEKRLVNSLEVGRKQNILVCNKQAPNAVILPRQTPDGADSVYILTPQPDNGVYSLGGHHRFDIKDGKILSDRKFANSCLMINKAQMPSNAAAFFVTHLLDVIPTEIHVFTMLAAQIPITVSTAENNSIWSVEKVDGAVKISLQNSDE